MESGLGRYLLDGGGNMGLNLILGEVRRRSRLVIKGCLRDHSWLGGWVKHRRVTGHVMIMAADSGHQDIIRSIMKIFGLFANTILARSFEMSRNTSFARPVVVWKLLVYMISLARELYHSGRYGLACPLTTRQVSPLASQTSPSSLLPSGSLGILC